MKLSHSISIFIVGCIAIIINIITLQGCCNSGVPTPSDDKHIQEYHVLTNKQETSDIESGNLSLFVDYSNCIADGMASPFYQKMVSPLTAATKEYWSIKGSDISKEEGSVYDLLNNIQNTNYSALDKAINQMASLNSESVLLTDGELFTQTATKNNPNNPYMHDAFKTWLLRGHDIHIIAEPYIETYNGRQFNKKRFYIIFTDDRIEGNVYHRIKQVVDFTQSPEVDEFHLSGNYPWIVPTNGVASTPNADIAASVKSYGNFEVQEWPLSWENITAIIANAFDEKGTPLVCGDKLIGGLKINRNAFGCYRISDIGIRVTNINDSYNTLYDALEQGQSGQGLDFNEYPIEKFVKLDNDEFKRHSSVDIYLDINNFAPDKNTELNGRLNNYFKIEIYIKDIENILENNIEIFNFDSLTSPGQNNISISESLKNCVFDPELINKLKGKVLYTIYVKSEKY